MATKEKSKTSAKKEVKKDGGSISVTKDVAKKKRPKQFASEEKNIVPKVDLRKKQEDAVQEPKTKEVPVEVPSGDSKKMGEETEKPTNNAKNEEKQIIEEVKEELKEEVKENSVLEEVKEEEQEPQKEKIVNKVEEEIKQPLTVEKKHPENLQKLIDFMDDTGGSVEDYVAINKDYNNVDDKTMLRDYYQRSKKHLNSEEIDFLIEDKFDYEEDVDDEKEIKRKKLAFKEEAAKAREHANQIKNKYYDEIKSGAKLAPEQQKAVEFFNRYEKEKEESNKIFQNQKSMFDKKTKEVFNDKFKGFEYEVGEKKYRFRVNNADDVKNKQSDINNFVKKFLNKNDVMEDAKGYHKSLFTAMNADAVANHFYEQGKSDAIKESVAQSKNVDMNPRGTHEGVVESGGFKVRAVPDAENSASFKVRMNKNKIS